MFLSFKKKCSGHCFKQVKKILLFQLELTFLFSSFADRKCRDSHSWLSILFPATAHTLWCLTCLEMVYY